MNSNKNKPVQIVLTYNANPSEKEGLHSNVVSLVNKPETVFVKLDDNHKLVRRYSFDDNGGGYLGL